jgi:hypothetical protein
VHAPSSGCRYGDIPSPDLSGQFFLPVAAESDAEGDTCRACSEHVGLKLAASLGVLVPWGAGWAHHATSVADRMFVGGPESLRGFRSRGVGPSDLRRQVRVKCK